MKYDNTNVVHVVRKVMLVKLLNKLKVVRTRLYWDLYADGGMGHEVLEVI
mgnify:FL=1